MQVFLLIQEYRGEGYAKNLKEYLSCDKIVCCGGSWMVKGDLVKAGEFEKICEMTREASALVKSISA